MFGSKMNDNSNDNEGTGTLLLSNTSILHSLLTSCASIVTKTLQYEPRTIRPTISRNDQPSQQLQQESLPHVSLQELLQKVSNLTIRSKDKDVLSNEQLHILYNLQNDYINEYIILHQQFLLLRKIYQSLLLSLQQKQQTSVKENNVDDSNTTTTTTTTTTSTSTSTTTTNIALTNKSFLRQHVQKLQDDMITNTLQKYYNKNNTNDNNSNQTNIDNTNTTTTTSKQRQIYIVQQQIYNIQNENRRLYKNLYNKSYNNNNNINNNDNNNHPIVIPLQSNIHEDNNTNEDLIMYQQEQEQQRKQQHQEQERLLFLQNENIIIKCIIIDLIIYLLGQPNMSAFNDSCYCNTNNNILQQLIKRYM